MPQSTIETRLEAMPQRVDHVASFVMNDDPWNVRSDSLEALTCGGLREKTQCQSLADGVRIHERVWAKLPLESEAFLD